MRKLLLTWMVLACFTAVKAQEFYMKDSGDLVTVNIPKKFKAYTYNKYTLTDTSLVITSRRDSLDLFIRDVRNNKTVKFIFSESIVGPVRIKGKEFYNPKVGQPALFSVTSDDDYILLSDKKINFQFIIDESGELVKNRNLPESNNFLLHKNYSYGFGYTSGKVGYQPIKLRLINDSAIVEIKEIPVTFEKADIYLTANVQISTKNFNREILFTITSSAPILSDIELEGAIELEINGFRETIDIAIKMANNTSKAEYVFVKSISGRQPRSFSVKNIILTTKHFYPQANYIFLDKDGILTEK